MIHDFGKKRLDTWLEENNFFVSRNIASNAISLGLVSVNGEVITKNSAKISTNDEVKIKKDHHIYVSRSANKLKFLIQKTSFSIVGLSCLDLGASTGGFTEVLLEHGASRVYAVDIGHDQLSKSLKENPKVINMERTDSRKINIDIIIATDLISIDLSFISLEKAIENVIVNAKSGTLFYILFKPQFEVGREEISKNGIVKNQLLVWSKLLKFREWLIDRRINKIKLFKSPILGKDGNQEWLFFGKKV
ncbi:MAG: TlyA family RNA methyltransferase [Hyphomicrobiales bacterium]|nr:TlyA family RNA methyltransferase [Hyphomicrobiales bacterium]